VLVEKNEQKVVVLGTGGTIAGLASQAHDNLAYAAAQIAVDQLMHAIPGMAQALGGLSLHCEQVAQLDSKDMDFAVWRALAERVAHHLAQAQVQAVLITHGTDTLEETAYFLQRVLPADVLKRKPVVMTCAMRPASSHGADGPQNVLDALAVARESQAYGVVLVCAGQVHGATDVQKVHTYRLDAFDSGDGGPLAYVEAGQLRVLRSWPQAQQDQTAARLAHLLRLKSWPRVDVLMHYAGSGDAMARALLAAGAGLDPVQGLVVAGTGNGTVNEALMLTLQQAMNSGLKVLRSSRCAQGRVLPGGRQDWAPATPLSPVKARIELMLELMAAA
jgi:L-asparaginase